jgi:putative ABC transport system ATP-binding protein
VTTLRLADLTIEYARGGYRVRPIDGLDLQVDDGELVLLLGASGSGKTTLLSAMATLLTPAAGTIRLDDIDVTALSGQARTDYRRSTVGIVFQAFNLLSSLTALENVAMPLWSAGVPGRAARDRSRELLTELGLEDRLRHRPSDLSGGQQQRVAIARALAPEPRLLLADEPTAHLDEEQVGAVLQILRRTAAPGRIVVVATHDERMLPIADRIVELSPVARPAARPEESIELAAGQVLFSEGEVGDVAYVVERGEIELTRVRADGTEEVVHRAGPGHYFGELAPLLRLRRSATARAVVPSVVTSHTPRDLRHGLAQGYQHHVEDAGSHPAG